MNRVLVVTLWFVCIFTITPYVYAADNQITSNELKHLVNKTVNDLVRDMQPNGTILVASQNEIIFEQGFGFADLSTKTLDTSDTQYLLASASKQFTAVAILKAIYNKNMQDRSLDNDIANLQLRIEMDLNRNISYYLPESHPIWAGNMPLWAEEVTVHQLLVHSSVLVDVVSLPGFSKFRNSPPNKASDLISYLKSEKLEFKPGSKYSYSNSNYFLLGEIVQQITGLSLDAYMQKVLFNPLDMHSTFMAAKGTVNDLKQSDYRFKKLARGYNFDVTAQHIVLTEEIKNYEPMQIPGGAGSIISTAPDILKWNTALYSGKIIPMFLLKMMLTPYMPTEKTNISYGYGIKIVNSSDLGTYYFHNGSIPGFRSNLTYIPSLQLTIIFLTNIEADQNKRPEIKKIELGLSEAMTPSEGNLQVNKIMERRYPFMVDNNKRYDFRLIGQSIITELELHYKLKNE